VAVPAARHRLRTVLAALAGVLLPGGLVVLAAGAVASDEPGAYAAVAAVLLPVNGLVLDLAARRALTTAIEAGSEAPAASGVAPAGRTAAGAVVLPVALVAVGLVPVLLGLVGSPLPGALAIGAAAAAELARRRVAELEADRDVEVLVDRPTAWSRTVSWRARDDGRAP
jgi:hypothetical protein